MLTQWTLENYKSVYSRTQLELRPLTVFVGPNSSGKSTFIQSMLLVAQTLSDPLLTRSVVLNGRLLKAGFFDDIRSSGSPNSEVAIGFSLNPGTFQRSGVASRRVVRSRPSMYYHPHEIDRVECEFSFTALGVAHHKQILQLQPRITSSHMRTQRRGDDARDLVVDVRRSAEDVEAKTQRNGIQLDDLAVDHLDSLGYEVVSPTGYPKSFRSLYYDAPASGSVVGARFVHFIPVGASIVYNAVDDAARKAVNWLIRPATNYASLSDNSSEYLNSTVLKRVIDTIGSVLAQERGPRARAWTNHLERAKAQTSHETVRHLVELTLSNSQVAAALQDISEELIRDAKVDRRERRAVTFAQFDSDAYPLLADFFTNSFRYLGPLRDEPKVVYPLEASRDPEDIGLRGEHTAAVLDLHRNTRVIHVPPDGIAEGDWDRTAEDLLHIAVTQWLEYFGLVRSIETEDRGVYGHELRVSVSDKEHRYNLVHVGVGVSQVMPILVMSLLSEPGTVLVFEQPELHLHPKVQSRLADFLISMTRAGRQCIVETHSEYLISRLRLRAAEDSGSQIAGAISLYHVERPAEQSTYTRVSINRYGAIEQWPEGFFDESNRESERIVLAAMRKRAERQE